MNTAGPWKVLNSNEFRVEDMHGNCVAIANVVDPQTAMHDAILIAAAPELLEACKALLGQHHQMSETYVGAIPDVNDKKLWDIAEAIIAKAEGRS